jgi:hypothetical protein
MLKMIGLAVALVCVSALPVMAQAACTAPTAPTAVDGTTATKDQLIAGINAAKAFIAASDTYQECLNTSLEAQKKIAEANKVPLDPSITNDIATKGGDSQTQKERVGAQINAAVTAYKKLHPN